MTPLSGMSRGRPRRTEGERDAAVVLCPAGDVHGEVGPEQVVDDAGVGDVQCAPQASDLVHDANLWREAAYWDAVGDVTELLPRLDGIAALAFVVEAVDAHDRCTYMIAPKQKDKSLMPLVYSLMPCREMTL